MTQTSQLESVYEPSCSSPQINENLFTPDPNARDPRLEQLKVPHNLREQVLKLADNLKTELGDEYHEVRNEALWIIDYLEGTNNFDLDPNAQEFADDLLNNLVAPEKYIQAEAPLQSSQQKDILGAALLLSNIVEEVIGPNDSLMGLAAYELRQMLNGNSRTVMPVSRVWKAYEKDGEIEVEMSQDMKAYALELIEYYEELGFPNVMKAENVVAVDYCERDGYHFGSAINELTDEDPTTLELRMRLAEEVGPGLKRLVSFINTPTSQKLAQLLGLETVRTDEATENMNNKGNFQAALRKNGLKGALNLRMKSIAQAMLAALWTKSIYGEGEKTGGIAKASRGASGYGNLTKEKTPETMVRRLLEKECRTALEDTGFSVMEWMNFEEENSPGVLIWIDPEDPSKDQLLGIADQVLKGESKVYVGSLGCTNLEHWEKKYPGIGERINYLRAVLREQEAFGFQGIDYVQESYPGEDRDGRMSEIENNCRITGQTHVANQAKLLGFEYYGVHNTISVPKGMKLKDFVNTLKERGLHYNETDGGVFVTNHSNSPEGYFMVGILAHNMDMVQFLFEEMETLSLHLAMENEAKSEQMEEPHSLREEIHLSRAELLPHLQKMGILKQAA